MTLPPHVRQPLVLRQEPTEFPNSENHYRMVGTAYIDGVMSGECLDVPFVAEIGLRELSEFLIH